MDMEEQNGGKRQRERIGAGRSGSEQTFEEKLAALLEEAKKKKNVLENQEVWTRFGRSILDPDQLDKIYEFLEQHQVDVLRHG